MPILWDVRARRDRDRMHRLRDRGPKKGTLAQSPPMVFLSARQKRIRVPKQRWEKTIINSRRTSSPVVLAPTKSRTGYYDGRLPGCLALRLRKKKRKKLHVQKLTGSNAPQVKLLEAKKTKRRRFHPYVREVGLVHPVGQRSGGQRACAQYVEIFPPCRTNVRFSSKGLVRG